MRKPFSMRLSDEEAAALKQAALDDQREAAALARKILVDWLRANGYLTR